MYEAHAGDGEWWSNPTPVSVHMEYIIVDKQLSMVINYYIPTLPFVCPNGNYMSNRFGDFTTAKYHFLLGQPKDMPFERDFAIALENMGRNPGPSCVIC